MRLSEFILSHREDILSEWVTFARSCLANADVTRLWIATAGELTGKDLQDLVRFNEAIDQGLAESTSRFMENLDNSRELFLAMMSHDLRTPLGAIIGWADVMVNAEELPKTLREGASHILNSGERMNALLGDLLDFTRSRLGSGIPIVRADMDVANVARHTIDEIAALHPKHVVKLEATGKLQGKWDEGRVSQALSNLINNAVRYGSDTTPIHVTLRGDAEEVVLAVQNRGPVIRRNELDKIFDPMHRGAGDQPVEPTTNLGLGLYMCRIEIVPGARCRTNGLRSGCLARRQAGEPPAHAYTRSHRRLYRSVQVGWSTPGREFRRIKPIFPLHGVTCNPEVLPAPPACGLP